LALAAGQWLAGHPWFGVAGSYAAMLAAFWWAFHAWLPRRWAGIACALLLGAAGRMRDRFRPAPAAMAGIGLSMLALARPYEGLAFSVALLAPVSRCSAWALPSSPG